MIFFLINFFQFPIVEKQNNPWIEAVVVVVVVVCLWSSTRRAHYITVEMVVYNSDNSSGARIGLLSMVGGE